MGRAGQEGPGPQALMTMNAISFARATGLRYLHTPFVLLYRADREVREALFNLGESEAAGGVDRHDAFNYCYNSAALELLHGWKGREDELTRHFFEMVPEFRRRYYRAASARANEELVIAVNIRRGPDVSANLHAHLFTPTDTILRTLADVRTVVDAPGYKYRVDVYSNGDEAEFTEFARLGASVFTNPKFDPARTMRELIEADVLVMAESSFSLYAALMSDGIRIFPFSSRRTKNLLFPWGIVPPTEDWIPRAADGSIDRAALERRLFTVRT